MRHARLDNHPDADKLNAVEEKKRAALDAYYRRKYNSSLADVERMEREQGGVCKICKRPPKTRRLNLDHDHKTGRVRGLLCWRCNKGLQMFSDSPTNLIQAAKYLSESENNSNVQC